MKVSGTHNTEALLTSPKGFYFRNTRMVPWDDIHSTLTFLNFIECNNYLLLAEYSKVIQGI